MHNSPFLIGLTADMTPTVATAVESAISRELGDLADVRFEVMGGSPEVAAPEVADRYDAILALATRFPAGSFQGLTRLGIIARWGVGYDRIDVPACTEAGVLLAITPEAIRRPVAEGVFALMFALTKRLLDLDRLTRSGEWRRNLPDNMICIEGRSLGSVGMGNIAGEMFRMARGLNMGRLMAYDPYANPETAKQLGVDLVSLEELLRESDFVTVNCFLNAETQGLINSGSLALMKPTAYLINTARGPIVNEADLYAALAAHRIAGAGLDVFEQEPTPKDNPLFTLPNVVLAPHAVAWTEESIRDNSVYACRNIRSFYKGEVPKNTVNRDVVNNPKFQQRLVRRPA